MTFNFCTLERGVAQVNFVVAVKTLAFAVQQNPHTKGILLTAPQKYTSIIF